MSANMSVNMSHADWMELWIVLGGLTGLVVVGWLAFRFRRKLFGASGRRAAPYVGAAAVVGALLLLSPVILGTRHGVHGRAVLVIGPILVVILGALVIGVTRWMKRRPAPPGGAAGRGPTPGAAADVSEERRMVLRMVAEGKLSADDATGLLDAVGADRSPGDARPFGAGTRESVVGALIIVVGFLLPWAHVTLGGVRGYQSGMNVGWIGWVILLVGVAPAILACFPALERHVRQGLLRFIFAAMGSGFLLSMAVPMVSRGQMPGIGLCMCIMGFGVQVVNAAGQIGLRPAERAADAA